MIKNDGSLADNEDFKNGVIWEEPLENELWRESLGAVARRRMAVPVNERACRPLKGSSVVGSLEASPGWRKMYYPDIMRSGCFQAPTISMAVSGEAYHLGYIVRQICILRWRILLIFPFRGRPTGDRRFVWRQIIRIFDYSSPDCNFLVRFFADRVHVSPHFQVIAYKSVIKFI